MQARGATAVALTAAVALTVGAGSAAASSAGSVGIGDLAVSVGYRCMTTGTGPADWRTTAHVLTTVTNIGSESARGVSTLVQIPLTFGARELAQEIAPGRSVVYDHDTRSNALILNPVGVAAFGAGLDANPMDNLYAGVAPFVCSAL